jgi:hypothetical protein
MVIDAAALLHDVIWALRVEWLQCPMKNLPLVHSTDVAAGLLCFSGFQLHAIAPTSQPGHRPPAFVQRPAFWGAQPAALECTAMPPELTPHHIVNISKSRDFPNFLYNHIGR